MKQIVSSINRRRKLLIAAIVMGSMGIVPVVVLGGYQAIQAVDSSAFCTTSCHTVHYPEAVTYETSPHSEVTCAQCHVGEGTSNLVVSKIKGLKEILPTLTGNYHKPIATPLADRRPTSQTCEKCHWSSKFSGDVPLIETSYLADANNTKSQFTLVLKVNGGLPEVSSGIHWHSTGKVWYISADDQRKQIVWVGVEDASGNVTEYVDPNRVGEITPELIQDKKRAMDCIDCHNRITHLFRSPDELIDAALTDGSIDIKLPYIKEQGLAALVPQNNSLDEAYAKVEAINDYYKNSYPQIYQTQIEAITKSIAALKEVARQTTFSDGLDWNTHANNAVHNPPDAQMDVDWAAISSSDDSSGCFRCHGNLLKVEAPAQLLLAQALNENNIVQFADRVNVTIADLANAGPASAKGLLIKEIKPAESTVNGADVTGNNTIAGNTTSIVPQGAYGNSGLSADCNLCHYTRQTQTSLTPLAPAIPHPTGGLNDCLICHSPASARPFRNDHPWATNEACKSCHQSAPELQSLPTGPPVPAPLIPHTVAKLENCLSCHDPAGVKPFPATHPWATNEVCSACHNTPLTSGIISVATPIVPIVPMEIPHATAGLENCLSCHGQATIMAFTTPHPWGTSDTCSICHKPAANPKPLPDIKAVSVKEIPHVTTGLENCLSCHGQPKVIPYTTVHPWGTNQACAICHKPAQNPPPFPEVTAVKTVQIPHVTNGLENCLSCHGQPTVIPFKTAHPWNNNQACAICHKPVQNPQPFPQVSAIVPKQIPHVTNGLENCLSCHGQPTIMPFETAHPWNNNDACVICHELSPGTGPVTPPSLGPSPAIPHSISGLPGCTACHKTGGPASIPANHAGRPETFCTLCHAPGAGASVPSILVSGPAIPHTIAGLPGCTACHQQDGPAPFPTSHAGRPDSFCTICHQAGSAITVPAAPGNLAASVVNAGRVDLTWSDNANTETGFRIERATDAGFSNSVIRTNVAANSTSYGDTTTFGNTAYYYRVFAVNSAGDSAASNAVNVTTPVSTVTPPATPSGLTAIAASATQVGLTWADNANSETGFRVDRALNSAFTTNLTSVNVAVNTIAYSDTTVTGNTTYYYRVLAFNSGGNSGVSNTATATTPVPVIDPAALYAADCASCHGNNRQGGSATALTTADLTGRTLAQVTAKLTTGTMASYTGTWTSAQIAAVSQWLKGNPPAAAGGLAALAVSAGQVNLTWTDNANDETGYRIERAANNAFTSGLVTLTTTAANAVSYSDVAVSGNSTYYYRVIAVNAVGDSAASNTASVTTPVSATPPPAAPSGLTAVAVSATQVGLTWADNANSETGFRVDRALNSAFTTNLTSVNVAANTTAYSDTAVSGNTTYYYRVLAFNSGGNSGVSNTATATTPVPAVDPAVIYAANCASCHGANRQGGSATALTSTALAGSTAAQITSTITNGIATMPAYSSTLSAAEITALTQWLKGGSALAPANLAATAVSAGQVNLTWADPNSGNETGFQVDRATNAAFTLNLISVNIGAGAAGYADTTTAGNTTYYYRVFTVNSAGNSAASNTASAATPASSVSAPAAPTSLTATGINGGQVNLTWVSTAVNRNGFRVDRALDSGFTSGLVSVNTGNVTNYSDNSVSASTLYYYRVYAFNAGGLSPASNTASVTTPAASPAQVYAANCASCHGNNGQGGSAPAVAGAATPTTIIVVRGGGPTMPSFTTTQISATQLTALATYVAGQAPEPTTGAGLYSLNCAVCHGDTGLGTTKGPGLAGVPAATLTPLAVNGLLPIMPAYPSTAISSSGMSTLATYIAAMAPPATDGWGVYAAWCARCHGVYGTQDNIVGDTSISSAVRNGVGGDMPAFSTAQISNTALTNLQAYVAGGLVPPNTGPLAAPTSLTAAAVSSTSVSLSWNDPNNGVGETGIRLQRSTSSSFSTTTSFTLAAGATSYTDNGVTASATYYYRVQARGSANSGYSNTVSVTTPATGAPPPAGGVPPAPGNLFAAAFNATRVNLTWVDNGNETGFRLQRALNNSFTTSLTTVSLAANAVSYSDNNVTANSTYYYRIIAYNSAGNSTASNVVSLTTPVSGVAVPTFDAAAYYSTNCARCHGANRQGGSDPALTASALSSWTVTQLTTKLTTGSMGRYAPGLTSSQVTALVQWLKT